jgi:hypothetical protein
MRSCEYNYLLIFKNTFMSSLINIFTKQKKNDVVEIIFDEYAALDLSDIISDFIADRFNRLPTFFTIPQLRCMCSKHCATAGGDCFDKIEIQALPEPSPAA